MGADRCRGCGGQVVRVHEPGKPAYHCSGCDAYVTKREYRLREIEAEPCPLCRSQVVRVKPLEFKCRGCGNSRVLEDTTTLQRRGILRWARDTLRLQ